MVLFINTLWIILSPFIYLFATLNFLFGNKKAFERLGFSSSKPVEKKIVWFNAASVGEVKSIIPLVQEYSKNNPNIQILFTTNTKTSYLIVKNTFLNAVHQYQVFDNPFYVKRFLNKYKPSICFMVESGLWYNQVKQASKISKLVLINGRMSEKSFKRWQIAKKIIKEIYGYFDIIFAQSKIDKERIDKLSNKNSIYIGNLKHATKPKFDYQMLDKLKKMTSNRNILLFASTHYGEEEIALKTHKEIKKLDNNLLTIIAPRHPERTSKIAKMFKNYDIKYFSKNDIVENKTEIYFLDKVGYLSTFYDLATIVYVGRSLAKKKRGGQNMWEPANLGKAVIVGRSTENFTEVMTELKKNKAIIVVNNESELIENIKHLITSVEYRKTLENNAKHTANQDDEIVNSILKYI